MDDSLSFGSWLKQRRKALDLTQSELARRAGCAAVTLQKIEAEERRPSNEIAARLAEALELPPEERTIFIKVARAELGIHHLAPASGAASSASLPAARLHHNHLPVPLTPLIGRAYEVAALNLLLQRDDVRLVTLTGVGGTGKTRLAIQVAGDLQHDFADGITFVELAPLTDPDLVATTIAQALGVQEAPGQPLVAQIKAYLRNRQHLLVLDNFEHLLAAAPLVTDLLRAAPGLTVLVTSRAVLRLSGEHEYPVLPLNIPAAGLPLDEVAQNEAVRLFVTRAQAAKPDFQFTAANGADIAAICVRLDGLPLALELAAARVKLLPPHMLLADLSAPLQVLTGRAQDLPRRHQTLEAAIAWSYDLLDADEQDLFCRLGVFAGGFTLEAAEWVMDSSHAATGTTPHAIPILDRIHSLLDKSLLDTGAGRRRGGRASGALSPDPRFGMLETIHEFALQRLRARGEDTAVRAQHARCFLHLAETAEPQLRGAAQTEWLNRLEADLDNLRAALAWLLRPEGTSADAEAALRLAGALGGMWHVRGYLSEGQRWIEQALERHRQSPAPQPAGRALRARALYWAAMLACWQGDRAATADLSADALRLYQELGDRRGIAFTLKLLAIVARDQGDYVRARARLEESLALFQHLESPRPEDQVGAASTLHNLGDVMRDLGDHRRAAEFLEESLRLFRVLGDTEGIAWALFSLGELASRQRAYERAAALYVESLRLNRELDNKWVVALVLSNLGRVYHMQGDDEHALALYEESLDLHRELGDKACTADALAGLGMVAIALGDDERAQSVLTESLHLFHAVHDNFGIARCLAGLATVAGGHGRPRRGDAWAARHAGRLFGAAAAIHDALGTPPLDLGDATHERLMAAVRAQLDAPTFDVALAEGRAMTPEQAIAYALEGTRTSVEDQDHDATR